MKTLELLQEQLNMFTKDIDEVWISPDRIKEAIKELEEYQGDMDSYLDYTTGSRCTKSFNSCLGSIKIAYGKELEKLVKENSEDRLAELEKVILDYYLAKGYRIGVGGWAFRVEIISYHKYKRMLVYFKEHHLVNSSFAFSTINKTTKEMFDKAFEYFSIKDSNAK